MSKEKHKDQEHLNANDELETESTMKDDEKEQTDIKDEEGDIENLSNSEHLLELKIKELQDQYLRTHADFENVKKRLEKEKAQALEYANQNLLRDILPVADTLDKALESANSLENGEKVAEGLNLTISNLLKILNKYGVELIDASNGFDPNLHDAIMQVKNQEKEDGQIEQVLQKGYKYKERVLRPAMVSIVKN